MTELSDLRRECRRAGVWYPAGTTRTEMRNALHEQLLDEELICYPSALGLAAAGFADAASTLRPQALLRGLTTLAGGNVRSRRGGAKEDTGALVRAYDERWGPQEAEKAAARHAREWIAPHARVDRMPKM